MIEFTIGLTNRSLCRFALEVRNWSISVKPTVSHIITGHDLYENSQVHKNFIFVNLVFIDENKCFISLNKLIMSGFQ